MKSRLVCSLFAIAFCVTQMALAQSVERPRPAGWDRIVPGGRFMDRFEESKPIGPLTSECWGGDNVKPRDVRNGMEEPDYSYWGGNIVYVDGRYHLFVARWKESEPKGHMFWPNSEIAHCVSPRSDGDFKFVEVLGQGHNPELFRCKDGSFAVYCIDSKSQAHVYRSATVNGQWKYERLPLDLNGRKLIEGESNFSFTRRPDGSVLAVCRGGAIWLSEDGIKPFVMMTGRVYPDVAGRFEDPVLWRDEVQYHLVVNDWLGRVAWYLTSPDGFNWTTQPGEAYMPGIARVAGGVTNEWFKYERMRVTTDVYGRVFQANFAVIDCVKREDRGGDIHSSKNITIPVNPGRRVQTFRKTRRGWEIRIMKERGFNPLTDVDVESVTFGPQSMVAFGAGVKPVGTDEANGDLVLIFPLIELDTPVVKALGREKSGRLFFATCRVDGTKLAGDCRFGAGDVAKGPSVPCVRNSDPTAESEAIAGVIGWLPIAADDFGNLLDEYLAAKSAEGSKKGGLVGLRHVVQDEPDDEFILRPDFMRGVRRLRGTGLVYDILVFQRQLANAIKFVDAQADDQQFVLDHVGKPMPGRESEWAELVREMARRENVACKFSGVVTEVGTGFDSVRRVFDTVLEAFGPNRLMWGSDWPVVTVKIAYRDWKELVDRLVSPLSESERMAILGATAARVYGLERMK